MPFKIVVLNPQNWLRLKPNYQGQVSAEGDFKLRIPEFGVEFGDVKF